MSERHEESTPPHEVPHDAPDTVVHEYDGIQEYDNQLPKWWLYTLYMTVAFAAIYWAGYHSFPSADLPNAAFQHELDAQRAREAEALKKSGAVTGDALALLSKDAATTSKGKEVFVANCAACHKADASGLVGPNLTDNAWLHGGKPEQVYKTINEGYVDKQMPAWGPTLGPERVQAVAAYVLSLRNTNVPGGKAPQGEIEN